MSRVVEVVDALVDELSEERDQEYISKYFFEESEVIRNLVKWCRGELRQWIASSDFERLGYSKTFDLYKEVERYMVDSSMDYLERKGVTDDITVIQVRKFIMDLVWDYFYRVLRELR